MVKIAKKAKLLANPTDIHITGQRHGHLSTAWSRAYFCQFFLLRCRPNDMHL